MNTYKRYENGKLVEHTTNEAERSRETWPLILRPMKLLAQPEDKGLGDIIARTVGPVGGDKFKRWYKITFGRTCGCEVRQEAWNKRYSL